MTVMGRNRRGKEEVVGKIAGSFIRPAVFAVEVSGLLVVPGNNSIILLEPKIEADSVLTAIDDKPSVVRTVEVKPSVVEVMEVGTAVVDAVVVGILVVDEVEVV